MSKTKIATFLYHDVSNRFSESGFQRRSAMPYKMTQSVFADHLDEIARSGLKPELVTQIDFDSPGKHMAITFDDGGKGAVEAAEELNRRGWKGHFFITTGLLGSSTFLDAKATRYLHSCGHVIGSHSHTHPDIFNSLTFDQMVLEWRISSRVLSDLLGTSCETASVPGGDVSPLVFKSADAADLKFLFTSDPFLSPRREGSCRVLGRVCPKSDKQLSAVRGLAEFRGWNKELARYRAKTLLKSAFSPLYQLYVRRALQ